VTDLNVMTRRGRGRATMRRCLIEFPLELQVSQTAIVLSQSNFLTLTFDGTQQHLGLHDAVVFEEARPGLAVVESGTDVAAAIIIELKTTDEHSPP
jgi:environmental stress-induced protein Ves